MIVIERNAIFISEKKKIGYDIFFSNPFEYVNIMISAARSDLHEKI